MNKFSIDFATLQDKLTQKKAYRLEDVKDRIRKVAFDVVRLDNDDDVSGLWQIMDSSDGSFIVAMYDDEDSKETVKSSSWSVAADNKNLNIFYKNDPVTKVAIASLGVPEEDVGLVARALPAKLEKNKKLTGSLLMRLDVNDRQAFMAKYPELLALF